MPTSIFGILALERILAKLDADIGWWQNQKYSIPSGSVGSNWLVHCSLLFGVKLLISVFARQHWSDLKLDLQNSCCQISCIMTSCFFFMTEGKKMHMNLFCLRLCLLEQREGYTSGKLHMIYILLIFQILTSLWLCQNYCHIIQLKAT